MNPASLFLYIATALTTYLICVPTIPSDVYTFSHEVYSDKLIFNPPKLVFRSIKSANDHPSTKLLNKGPLTGYSLTNFTSEDCFSMLDQNLPKYAEMVRSFKKGVMQSDFCRYAYVYVYGGVYIDSDVDVLQPPSKWANVDLPNHIHQPKRVRMVMGLEIKNVSWWKGSFLDPFQIVQWSFAAEPQHPVLLCAMEDVYKSYTNNSAIFKRTDDDIIKFTGPGVTTRCGHQYYFDHGGSISELQDVPVMANDLYIGTVSLFDHLHDSTAFVAVDHHFAGSWRDKGQ